MTGRSGRLRSWRWTAGLAAAALIGAVHLYVTSAGGWRAGTFELAALGVHVLAGALLVPVLLGFVAQHARARSAWGSLALGGVLAAAASGVALLAGGRDLRDLAHPVHLGVAALAVGAALLHRPRRARFAAALAVAVAGVALAAVRPWPAAEESRTFEPSPFVILPGPTALLDDDDTTSCARCHPDVAAQWASSVHHRSSFNNPFYAASVKLTFRTRGETAARWCAGCHDPVVLAQGELSPDVPPDSPEGDAGIGCRVCHGMAHVADVTGNGNYTLRPAVEWPYPTSLPRAAHDALVSARPAPHAASVAFPEDDEDLGCATCHKVHLEPPVNGFRWLRGQDDWDPWQDSGWAGNNPESFFVPPRRETCRSCHMPLEPAVAGDRAARDGQVRSHRFLAANTAVPAMAGDADTVARTEAFLQKKLAIAIVATRGGALPSLEGTDVAAGREVQLDVVVANRGVGHAFPGGTADSNEAWIELAVDVDGERRVVSGAIGPDGTVDPDAHFYRVVLVDRDGAPILHRNAPDAVALVYANVLGPGSADLARYRLAIPPGARQVTVRAELRWRKFREEFTRFALGEGHPPLPVTTLAEDTVVLDVAAPRLPERPWRTVTEYAVALLLDGETGAAVPVAARAAALDPAKIEPLLVAARSHLVAGQFAEAATALAAADARLPSDPRVDWFRAVHARATGDLGAAADGFRRATEVWPSGRRPWLELGRTEALAGRWEPAEHALRRALAVDPEDARAWRQLAAVLRSRGDDPAAAEAEAAFERYRVDETAQESTRGYRGDHGADQRMSQVRVVHEIPW